MLTYLFLITIVYEIVGLVHNIYKYKTKKLRDGEKELIEREHISKESIESAFVISIFSCVGFILFSIIGIIPSFGLSTVIAEAFIGCSAFGASTYAISYSKGINRALLLFIYNFVMMVLFILSIR